jgi:hypothetical protein
VAETINARVKLTHYDGRFAAPSELNCPKCGCNYMHKGRVTVFDRGEDAPFTVVTVVEGFSSSTRSVPSQTETNPSSRRDDLAWLRWGIRPGTAQGKHGDPVAGPVAANPPPTASTVPSAIYASCSLRPLPNPPLARRVIAYSVWVVEPAALCREFRFCARQKV